MRVGENISTHMETGQGDAHQYAERLSGRVSELMAFTEALYAGDSDHVAEVAGNLREALALELTPWKEAAVAASEQSGLDSWGTYATGMAGALSNTFAGLKVRPSTLNSFVEHVLESGRGYSIRVMHGLQDRGIVKLSGRDGLYYFASPFWEV